MEYELVEADRKAAVHSSVVLEKDITVQICNEILFSDISTETES